MEDFCLVLIVWTFPTVNVTYFNKYICIAKSQVGLRSNFAQSAYCVVCVPKLFCVYEIRFVTQDSFIHNTIWTAHTKKLQCEFLGGVGTQELDIDLKTYTQTMISWWSPKCILCIPSDLIFDISWYYCVTSNRTLMLSKVLIPTKLYDSTHGWYNSDSVGELPSN